MSYYVAQKFDDELYVSSVTKNPDAINYSDNIEQAMWHENSTKVQQLIDRNGIQGVSTTLKDTDHPGSKPHIP